jgi:hypothetical protein
MRKGVDLNAAVPEAPLYGLRFPEPPPLGTSIRLATGQDFELVKAEPYTRQTDERPSALLTWATTCPETGDAVVSVTGLSFNTRMLRRFSPSLTMRQITEAATRPVYRKPAESPPAELLAPVLAAAAATFGTARFKAVQLYEVLRQGRPDVLDALVPGKDNRWRLSRFATELQRAHGCEIGGWRLGVLEQRPRSRWYVVMRAEPIAAE